MTSNEEIISLSQEFKEYNKTMAKYGLYGSILDDLNNGDYEITLTTKIWHLENRKRFSDNPQNVITAKITARKYACYISSVSFFKDRVGMSYTPVGYIPTRLTCYNADRNRKIERIFDVIEKEKSLVLKFL